MQLEATMYEKREFEIYHRAKHLQPVSRFKVSGHFPLLCPQTHSYTAMVSKQLQRSRHQPTAAATPTHNCSDISKSHLRLTPTSTCRLSALKQYIKQSDSVTLGELKQIHPFGGPHTLTQSMGGHSKEPQHTSDLSKDCPSHQNEQGPLPNY